MNPLWWLIAAAVLAILEVVTVDLTFIMLAGGALSAAGMAWLWEDSGIYSQSAFFIIVSILLLLVVRPWAKRHLSRHTPNLATNASALVGRHVQVTETVTTHSGYVSVGGQRWSARTEHPGEIPAGRDAYIVRIDGATALVASTPVATQSPSS